MEKNQNQLTENIISKIHNQPENRITFYEFMNSVLYEPELGYYTKDRTKIGKAADFYTSSSVGPVFGKTIANTFMELLPASTNGMHYQILEMGGGNGRFARDALDGIREKEPLLYENLTYYMIETSPYHRQLQFNQVKDHLEHVIWIDSFSEISSSFEGVIFSNELVDAFPVHMVQMLNGTLHEIYVTWNQAKEQFEEEVGPLSTTRLQEYFVEQGITLKEEQIAEVNLAALDWLESVSQFLQKGYLITIDYGYPADELYASHRQNGTLMCYHKHIANDNPFQNIGDQDVTSHVNFTQLMDKGITLGLETIFFSTQSHFLMNSGILNSLQEITLNTLHEKDIFHDEALKMNRAIRQLITPGEMGETFKVLVQQKNVSKKSFRFLTGVLEQFGLRS